MSVNGWSNTVREEDDDCWFLFDFGMWIKCAVTVHSSTRAKHQTMALNTVPMRIWL